MHLTPKWSK